MVLITIVLLGLLFTFYFYLKKKHEYWMNENVPHPKPLFIFGNVFKMMTLQSTLSDLLNHLYKTGTTSYVGFYNFLTPALVLRDPDVINDCLNKNFDNFADTFIRAGDPIASINPFFSEEKAWKILRKELTPNLSNLKIKSMLNCMQDVCQNMVSYLDRSKCSTRADELAFKFTGDNVLACAYGTVGNSFSNGTCVMDEVRKKMSMSDRIGVVTHTLGLFCPNLSKLFSISYLGKQVPEVFKQLIKEAIKNREKSEIVCNDFVDFLGKCKHKNDLSYLGHAMAFYLDGYETSAYLLTYALLELSKNLSVQINTQNEVDAVYKAENTIYSYEALKKMTYLENLVYETLRKHPVIKFLNRSCAKDCLLPSPRGDGKLVQIKKGTQVYIPVEAIHRDDTFYRNPKQFDPNRFNQNNCNERPKQSFLGFGYGPRVCPGQIFAVTQLKIALAAILLHFKITIDQKTVFPLDKQFYHLSKFPKNQIWLNFSRRH